MCSPTRADSRSRNSCSRSNRSSSWYAPVASSAARAISGVRGSGVVAAGSSSQGRHHISATRKIFVIGSRYSGSRVESTSVRMRLSSAPSAPGVSQPRPFPLTVTASGCPSSSIAREPTSVVPLRTNQPPVGSPSSSIRGSLIRYPSPSV